MLDRIEQACARAGRRAALGTVSVLLIAVGIAFFTSALWIFLVATFGAQQAALMIGGGYFGLGLILLGVLMSGSSQSKSAKPMHAASHSQPNNAPPVVQAFLYGLQAGTQASSARKA
ncbi:hypothetical protein ACERZ8_18505 [Tateyamaria armeniaca]|uniref:Phage holin family protein n=1 Tax=Tateyamaria armeniaca TaxID=2518930 RepID=A0ABW8UXJ6_9RHOB